MQPGRWLPGLEADPCHELAAGSGRMERDGTTIACHDMACIGHTVDFDLHSFHRRIHVARGGTRDRFLPQHVPRFDGLTELELNAFINHAAVPGKAKLKKWRKPFTAKRISACL